MRTARRTMPLLPAIALLAAACGGPTSPSPGSPAPPARVLTEGRYVMELSSGTMRTVGSGNQGFGAMMCWGQTDNRARLDVDVTYDGELWQGRAVQGTMTFSLRRTGDAIAGPVRGRATAIDGSVVSFDVASTAVSFGPPVLDGTVELSSRVRGWVEGTVAFQAGGCSATQFLMAR